MTSLGILTVLAAALIGAAVITRREVSSLPDRGEHLRRWSAAHAGIDPTTNRVVRWWLGGMYQLARPLARAGIHPDVVTVGGLWWALLTWWLAGLGNRWPLAATGALIVGSVADGVDGTLAALQGRMTRWGGVLDALVDRGGDLVFMAALLALGAHAWSAAAAGASLFFLEYLRARAGQSGANSRLVTLGERPTRLVLVGVSLWCAGLFPTAPETIATAGAWAVAAVSLIGFFQLLWSIRQLLD